MSAYPAGIFSPRTKANRPGVVYDASKTTVGYAEDVQNLDAEVVAIETELGANPKGAFTSVVARLGALLEKAGGIMTGNITMPATSWIGPSSTLGIYFASNKVGIGGAVHSTRTFHVVGSINATTAINAGTSIVAAGQLTGATVTSSDGNMKSNEADFSFINLNADQDDYDTKLTIKAVSGNIGVAIASPTAKFHLPAGTAAANTAPLKLTAGVVNTTKELGAVEFIDDGTNGHFYITLNVGGTLTRKEIAFV
jgi:hypothetical protein